MPTAPGVFARAGSGERRDADITAPVGDWWDGVTQINFTPSGILSTRGPSASTGSGTRRAPGLLRRPVDHADVKALLETVSRDAQSPIVRGLR
jgi:hypothetical protein